MDTSTSGLKRGSRCKSSAMRVNAGAIDATYGVEFGSIVGRSEDALLSQDQQQRTKNDHASDDATVRQTMLRNNITD
jgi:hypothetical protein